MASSRNVNKEYYIIPLQNNEYDFLRSEVQKEAGPISRGQMRSLLTLPLCRKRDGVIIGEKRAGVAIYKRTTGGIRSIHVYEVVVLLTNPALDKPVIDGVVRGIAFIRPLDCRHDGIEIVYNTFLQGIDTF